MRQTLLLAAVSSMVLAAACASSGTMDESVTPPEAQAPKGKMPGTSNGGSTSGSAGSSSTTSQGGSSSDPGPTPTSTSTSNPQPAPKPWDGSAPKGSVPMTGGTLIVLADGNTAVAADPDRDMVSIVDLAAAKVKAQIALPTGAEPGRLAADAKGIVHVVLRRGGGIADIDPTAGKLVGLRQTCALPRGIASHAADSTMLVTCLTGQLYVMSTDPAVTKPVAILDVTYAGSAVTDLRDVLVTSGGVFVTTFRSPQVFHVNGDGSVNDAPAVPATRKDTSADRLAAAGIEGGQHQNYVPEVAWRTIVGAGGDLVMVHEGGTDRVINVGNADNGGIHPTQMTELQCSGSDYGGTTCINVSVPGPPICVPPIVIGEVTSVLPDGQVVDGPTLPEGALPVDIAASPDGSTYTVVLAGNPSGKTSADGSPLLNVLTVPAAVGLNGQPTGMDFDSDLCGLANNNGLTVPGRPTSVTMDGQGQPVVLTREGVLQYITKNGVVAIPLSTTSVDNVGYNLFHDNTGRGMTCASCHAEGQDDARTWKFTPSVDANGNPSKVLARRTQTFRTGFLQTAPFHWDGEFAGMPDLMTDVFMHRMAASVAPSPSDEDTLEAWMNGIPPKMHDAPTPELAKSIANGKAIFEDKNVGCTNCHGGPNFTDNKNQDIGFGIATQTPSLIDVAFRAPYLHDGSVATLEARFSDPTAQSGKHGNTAALTSNQIADLVAYLKSL